MNTIKQILIAFVVTLAVGSTAIAGDRLPDYYPTGFSMIGQLGSVDAGAGIAVIGDMPVRFDVNVKVITPNTRFGTLQLLEPGMWIGVLFSPDPGEVGFKVNELWVLPKGYQPE